MTPAEQHFDVILAQQRAKGRRTYGKGLDHTEPRDWNLMALEEAIDMSQYLSAENLRLLEENANLKHQLERAERALMGITNA